jgi:adenosylmethionine-8-amino-7-oxononanoate aminotransferase
MNRLVQLDHQYLWHPFTQMRDWLKQEPILIVSANGATLRDLNEREYLDANSSIWVNLHGHNHPKINAAIARQLKKIAHSSALGFANEPASLLGEQLILAANRFRAQPKVQPQPRLEKVFYGDNGSTATEIALKLAYEFARRTRGDKHPRFLSLQGAYHGDTVGAVSLGHIDLFHKAFSGLLFKTDNVMAPYCYRCPFNRARPERADARDYRQCRWECLGQLERQLKARKKTPYTAFVFEPLMQGAAGLIPQPKGWLQQAATLAREHGSLLIADEVMTGFGRTGSLFACHQEGIQPDFMALAKGLTGGYLPMSATLTTQAVFDAFLGEYEEFKTFFHGHSFTGNQLGASAGLASLALLQSAQSQKARQALEKEMRRALRSLWTLPQVGDIRQVGLVAGIELVRDWRTRKPFELRERIGIRVCEAMARRGVLTRPVGNVIVLLPPYCTTPVQIRRMVLALSEAIEETVRIDN